MLTEQSDHRPTVSRPPYLKSIVIAIGTTILSTGALSAPAQAVDGDEIAVVQTAMDVVRRTYQPGDFPAGFGSFLLGLANWKSGDTERARGLMKGGAAVVQERLGWSHPVCLAIMNEYEQYPRSTHQKEEERAVRSELEQNGGFKGFREGQGMLSTEALFRPRRLVTGPLQSSFDIQQVQGGES